MSTDSTAAAAPSPHPQAAELELRHVSKTYPGSTEPAIRDLSLTVPAGEICVLVGPSGCGKTTAMRMVNRMIEMTGGDILLDGRSVRELQPAHLRREIGYVIQQIGLFPHRTIAENIAHRPELLGWDKQRIRARVDELLDADRARSRARRALPGAALRRPAPARRRRPRARRRPAADADGRAVRRDRPDQPRAPAERVPAPAGGSCARRSSSSPTTSTRRSRWATASRSCARAGSSPSTPRPRSCCWPRRTPSSRTSSAPTAALKRLALQRVREIDLWRAPLVRAGEPMAQARARDRRLGGALRAARGRRRAARSAGSTSDDLRARRRARPGRLAGGDRRHRRRPARRAVQPAPAAGALRRGGRPRRARARASSRSS